MSLAVFVLLAGLIIVPGDVTESLAPGKVQQAYTACVLAMSQQAYSEAVTACQRATQLSPQNRVYASLLRLAQQRYAETLATP
jgi:hypothetical protein